MENKNTCMMCSYFKVDDGVLPDFGTCTRGNFEVVSSDLACDKFEPKCENCKTCKYFYTVDVDGIHGTCNKKDTYKSVRYSDHCHYYEKKTEGRYPFGNDEDKVIKYCANDVVIIAEQMARDKQKELENKIEEYEKLFIEILNEVYEHPQLFKHNIHTYKQFILGHIRFLKNSFNTVCDKYDPVFEENAKLKEKIEQLEKDIKKKEKQLDVQIRGRIEDDNRIADLDTKFWLPLFTKIYGTTKVNKSYEDILSDISKLKDRVDGSYNKRKDALIEHLREEKKAKDDVIMKLKSKFDELNDINSGIIAYITKERDELKEKVEVLDKRNTNQSVIIGEKGKEIEELAKKNRHYEDIIKDIQNIISPEDNSIWSHSEIVYEIKNLKVYSEENETMYEDLKYWKERCHNAEESLSDVNDLKDRISFLERENEMIREMNSNQFKSIEKLRSEKKYLEERMTIMKDDIKYLKERYDAEDD